MDLRNFVNNGLYEAGISFFAGLGVNLQSPTALNLAAKDILRDYYKDSDEFKSIKETYFLGQIDDDIFGAAPGLFENKNGSFAEALQAANDKYKGIFVFAVKLEFEEGRCPTRTEIANIARAFNRASKMAPVIVLLKYRDSHGDYLSFTAIERTAYSQTWREGEKLGKVSMLRDINLLSPHTGHLRILDDLKLKAGVNSFDALYKQWRDVFDVQLLNKKFYQEISNWYFWAMDKVEFPADDCSDKEIRNATNLIRLLTRIIFVWFLKEKKLTPNDLFDENKLKDLLKYDDKTNSTYYKAVLQNLFFATLNAPMKKDKPNSRLFIDEAKQNGFLNEGYLQPGYYRYKRFMKDPDKLIGLLSEIPFLNGGLFECLDDLREGKAYRIDCFSNHKDNEARLTVPDELFFGAEKQVDLNKVYDTKNKKYFTRGLINILNSYKFTVAENTPIEEDIALDPELLGKVFENLLASFNPETKTTARKATGSYYTPREIVNYMVDESLIAFLETKLKEKYPKGEFEPRLRALLDYTENNQEIFNYEERSVLLDAIETVKILDPACGSGAYPMGALHKLVFALHKLDPDNKVWKAKLIGRTPREIREQTKRTLEGKSADYVRKLGLIENCIYGVDIQPIAIQISKLRFFISLIVEQTIEDSKENRGIKSLPNLEIKFVAANTLLGLEKPNENALNFTSPEVIEAEKRLFDVRRDLFYVDNYSDKKRLLKEEKKVRVTLREALAKDNYAQKTAEQIASWDPFDQNAQSDWFDPEFMFGISDGFDIVIGNPPYGAEYPKEFKTYFQNNYESAKTRQYVSDNNQISIKGSLDTFTLFIDKGIDLLKINSFLAFIVPLAITSSDSMTAIHDKIFKQCGKAFISTYSDRPKKIFDNAEQPVSIIIAHKNNQKINELYTTKVIKRYSSESIKDIISNLKFVNSIKYILPGRISKISYNIEQNILDKLFEIKLKISDLRRNEGKPIYYRTSGGRYYNIITNFSTNSNKEKTIYFDSEIRDLIGGILSSNLYFWYYHIYGNNLDRKSYDLDSFPIPINELTGKYKPELEILYNRYLSDLKQNSKEITTNYKHAKNIVIFYARKSKHLIDQIDLALKDAYGLSDEEINFIINYDLKFRTDDSDE